MASHVPTGPPPPGAEPDDLATTREVLLSLGRAVLVAAAVLVAVTIAGRLLGFDLHPLPALALASVVAVGVWAVQRSEDWSLPSDWHSPETQEPSLHVASDFRTRRIEAILNRAHPGVGVSGRELGRLLADLASERLVRDHGADPADPLAEADHLLSSRLVAHLRSVEGPDRVPPLSLSTVHAYLKEISSL